MGAAAGQGTGLASDRVYGVDIPACLPEPYGLPVQFDAEWHAAIKDEFENKWCKPLKVAGIRYRTVMEDGRAASVISAKTSAKTAA